jgi:hypothetical protein
MSPHVLPKSQELLPAHPEQEDPAAFGDKGCFVSVQGSWGAETKHRRLRPAQGHSVEEEGGQPEAQGEEADRPGNCQAPVRPACFSVLYNQLSL